MTLALAAVLLGPAAQGASATELVVGPEATYAPVTAIGDYNGDGKQDGATIRFTGSRELPATREDLGEIQIFPVKRSPEGAIVPSDTPYLRLTFSQFGYQRSSRVFPAGDFNGDGRDDILLQQGSERQDSNVLIGGTTETGTRTGSDGSLGYFDGEVLTHGSDLDGDGLHDIVGTEYAYLSQTSTMVVHWGRRAGTGRVTSTGVYSYRPAPPGGRFPTDPNGCSGSELATNVDVDGDGRGELLLGQCNALLRFTSREASQSGQRTKFTIGGRDAQLLAVGDVDGDGRDDVAVREQPGSADRLGSPSTLLLGRSGLAANGRVALESLSGPAWPQVELESPRAVGDLNGDGIGDLLGQQLVEGGTKWAWTVLLGARSAAGFATAESVKLDLASTEWKIEPAGDIDGDGRAELVACSRKGVGPCSGRYRLVEVPGGTASLAELSGFSLSRSVFLIGSPSIRGVRGTQVTTTLTKPASVRFVITPLRGGAERVAVVERPGGQSTFAWDGRIDGRRLRPGRYRVSAEVQGGSAAPIVRGFLILG